MPPFVQIEKIDINYVNEAMERLEKGDVHYRQAPPLLGCCQVHMQPALAAYCSICRPLLCCSFVIDIQGSLVA